MSTLKTKRQLSHPRLISEVVPKRAGLLRRLPRRSVSGTAGGRIAASDAGFQKVRKQFPHIKGISCVFTAKSKGKDTISQEDP